jgi:hypothetical protein
VPFLLATFVCGMAKKSSAGALSPALSNYPRDSAPKKAFSQTGQ